MKVFRALVGMGVLAATVTGQVSCFQDSDCTPPQTCDIDNSRTCTGGGGSGGKGASCVTGADCISNYCNANRVCAGYVDERCQSPDQCSAVLHTVCVSRRCQEGYLLYAERCGGNEFCASGQCATTCQAAKTDASCPNGNGDCRSFLCTGRVCQPGGAGQQCDSGRDCASTKCSNRVCEPGVNLADGVRCDGDSECASGTCNKPADRRDYPAVCSSAQSPTNAPPSPTNSPPSPTNSPPSPPPPTNTPPSPPPPTNTPPSPPPPTLPPSAAVIPTAPPSPTSAPPVVVNPTMAPPAPFNPLCVWFPSLCAGGGSSTPNPNPSPPTPSPPTPSPPTPYSPTPPPPTPGTGNLYCVYYGIGC